MMPICYRGPIPAAESWWFGLSIETLQRTVREALEPLGILGAAAIEAEMEHGYFGRSDQVTLTISGRVGPPVVAPEPEDPGTEFVLVARLGDSRGVYVEVPAGTAVRTWVRPLDA